MELVETRHGALGYTTIGAGKPLVLLHGNTMTAASQERLAQRFADEHRVTSVDLLGHGSSARPAGLFSARYFSIQGQALADMLHTLFPGTAVPLFGMSAGAITALNAVCEDSRHIAALILDSVFHQVGPATLAAHRTHVLHIRSLTWERYMAAQHGAEWWPRLRDGLLAVIEQLAERGTSVSPCLPDIQVPTLVFQGGRDQFCPEEQGRTITATIPGARLVYDSHAGHILAWKNPVAFREIVREFLRNGQR